MNQWWILGRDRIPVGPVNNDLVLQGIQAGRIPSDALVCELGGKAWLPIRDVSGFGKAFAKLRIDGPTMVDPMPDMPAYLDGDEPATMNNVPLRTFDDPSEHTIADVVHPLRPQPLSAAPLQLFDEVTESTIVEQPMNRSDPPR